MENRKGTRALTSESFKPNSILSKSKRSTPVCTRNKINNYTNQLLSCKRSTRALSRDINKKSLIVLPSSKRSQLTIFIIVAVLIIAMVILFFSFRGKIQRENPETAQIQNFVQECLDETSEFAVYDIAEKGGYEDPSKVSSTVVFNTPYYLRNNKSLMPSKEKIQEEISKSIEKQIDFCIDEFSLFPEYDVTAGKIIAESKIEPERVLVEINYPLMIIKDNSKFKLKDFNSEISVRFGIVYDAVAEFVIQSKDYQGVCISCLVNISSENDLQSSFSEYDDKTTIFMINDPQSELNNREFVYVFANEY
ncbi:MAG: hypothetical protein AABX44_00045 [Nanoarchaeota archaeon]